MHFGVHAKHHQTDHSALKASLEAMRENKAAEKQARRADHKNEAARNSHQADEARAKEKTEKHEAPERARHHEAARFAEKLAGSANPHAAEKRAPSDEAARPDAPEQKTPSHGHGVGRAPQGPARGEPFKAAATQAPSIRTHDWEPPVIDNDLARIIARAEAAQEAMQAKSLIESLSDFSAKLAAESEQENTDQPNADLVGDAYNRGEPQAGVRLALA